MNGAIYLVTKDFAASLAFYEAVLGAQADSANERFAVFTMPGLTLCLMNGLYDASHPDKVTVQGERYEIYDDLAAITRAENARKVFINLITDDLRAEHGRIRGLGIAQNLTEIRFVRVFAPYWYFTFSDPDGNPIEVTGGYKQND